MIDKGVIWWERYWLTSMLVMMPIVIFFIPLPFAVPVVLIGIVVDQPEEWPILPMYFGWCAISVYMMYRSDKYKENLNKSNNE